MTNLDLLVPPPPTITQVNVWATVTAVGPLRIQVDGDAAALPITPDTLVGGLAVNDRVYVALTTNTDPKFQARQAVVTGKSGGIAPFDPLTVFPVGSIYVSVTATNPGTLFGGTWAALQDAFLIGAGNLYAVNATGGEATHVLTVAEMPSHAHPLTVALSNVMPTNLASYPSGFNSNNAGTGLVNAGTVGNTGGDGAHNNMPPYLAVYMWKRTA